MGNVYPKIVRAETLASTQVKDLVSFAFLQSKMGSTDAEAEKAINRALQLYSDLKEVKVFNVEASEPCLMLRKA